MILFMKVVHLMLLYSVISLAAFEFPWVNLSLLFHYIMDKIDIRRAYPVGKFFTEDKDIHTKVSVC